MCIGKNTLPIFISTVGVLLLAQYTSGNVIPAAEDTHFNTKGNPSTENIQNSAVQNFTKELISFAFNEFTAFSNDSLYSLKEIFAKVIQDADAYEDVNLKYLEAEVEPFKKFIAELQKLEDVNNNIGKYDLLADIAETLDAYNTTMIREPSDEVLYIEKLLKKYGLAELVNELDIAAEHFVERFKNKAHEIWQQLPVEERNSDENLSDWLESCKHDNELLNSLFTYSWH